MVNISYISEWLFVSQAYNGTGGFADGSELDKFGRESDLKYSTRQENSKREYENIFTSKVSRFIGYLLKVPPSRQTDNTLLQEIITNADNQGNSIDIFLQTFAKNTKARGVNLVLVDMPTIKADNLQDQIENRVLPYVVEIHPERVLKYRLKDANSFEFVAYSDVVDNSTFEKDDVQVVTRYWDETSWRVYDDGNNIIEEGEHGMGKCPVLIFSEKGKFESLGEFAQIAGMSKKIFNLESELKLILRDQTFSILSMQADRGVTPELKLGTDNVLLYTGDKPPAFISADAAQAGVYETRITNVKESIDRVAYDVSTSKAAEAGISLDIKFQGLNGSLNSFAQRLEDLEREVWTLICNIIGVSEEAISLSYTQNFTIVDLNSEIEVMDGVTDAADLPLYKAEKLKKIVKQDLSGSEPDIMGAIYAEIDVNAKVSEVE